MQERAFPVVYAADVARTAGFYARLGFETTFEMPALDGSGPGYMGLRRGDAEMAVVTVASPEQLLGSGRGAGFRFEMFVYVDDVDETVARLRGEGVDVLREPEDMFWGERMAYVADPDGNPVALAAPGRGGTGD